VHTVIRRVYRAALYIEFSLKCKLQVTNERANEWTTPWAIKKSQHIFVCNFVKNQRILMQCSLLDFKMNETCDCMNSPTSPNQCCYTTFWKSKHEKCTWTQLQLLFLLQTRIWADAQPDGGRPTGGAICWMLLIKSRESLHLAKFR